MAELHFRLSAALDLQLFESDGEIFAVTNAEAA
jgi:hypothetical protein